MSGKRIVQAVVVAFLGIAGGGAVLILACGPTVTPYRLLGFLGCMFVLTGAVVVAMILWALSWADCKHVFKVYAAHEDDEPCPRTKVPENP